MRRFSLVVLSLVLFLAACTKSPNVTLPEIEGIFSDEDIDKATLSLATQVEDALGVQEAEVSGLTQGQDLPNRNADNVSSLSTQAVLPNTSGSISYIYYNGTYSEPWIIQMANNGISNMYVGRREIQSVGSSENENIFTVSMRETTSPTSDFEIYRMNLLAGTVQRLTNNTVDDTNVSLSVDGKTVAWQTSISGASSILFRVYSAPTTFTQKKLAYPIPAREPSISGNGKYISFVHDRTNGLDQLWRYDITNNVYTAIYSTPDTSAVLRHPSIADDGNRIMYLLVYPTNQDIQYIDLTTNQRRSAVYSTRTLEHPFITSDGKYLTYGYSGQLPSTNPGDFTVYAKEIATGQLAAVSYPDPNVRQFGMVWPVPNAIIAPNVPLVLSDQKINAPTDRGLFGWSVDISGTTAVVGSYIESYDANKDGFIDCSFGDGAECLLGVAYILEQDAQGIWNVTKRIENPVTLRAFNPQEEFGSTVAISGDTVVVGSQKEGYDADANGTIECSSYGVSSDDSECLLGRTYVFSRNRGGSNNWGLVQTLKANDSATQPPSRGFGSSVDVLGSTIVIGNSTFVYDSNGDNKLTCPSVPSECEVGSVYIFSQNQGGTNNWGLVRQIRPPTQNINNPIGNPALSGDTLLIASPNKNYISGTQVIWLPPSIYIYSRNQGGTNNWGLVKELIIAGTVTPPKAYLDSMAIDGNNIVVSFTSINTVVEKNLYIFSQNQGGINNWGQIKKTNLQDLGIDAKYPAVSISGDTILVNSPGAYDANQNGTIDCLDDSGPECNLGALYLFSRNQGGPDNWGFSKILGARDALTGGPNTNFGTPTAINGTTIIVGSPYDAEKGAVYIFKP